MGFFELLIIGVIALVVFGPEKLPKVIYDVGKTWRTIRRSANAFKHDFEQTISAEVKADEHNQKILNTLEENNIAINETLETLSQDIKDTPYNVNSHSKDQDTK